MMGVWAARRRLVEFDQTGEVVLRDDDRTLLQGFLNEAYSTLGYPRPEERAADVLRRLECNATLPEASREVATTCNRVRDNPGLSEQASVVWQLLEHLRPDVTCEVDRAPSFSEEWSNARAQWEKRYELVAELAAKESAELRLLDVCDPRVLFSFYDLPEDCD